MMVKDNELAENPSPRCPCVLVLDTSSSMEDKMEELNRGARLFLNDLLEDDFAIYTVELGIVTFGGRVVEQLPLTPIYGEFKPRWNDFCADGNTPIGAATQEAIDVLDRRKEEYKETGVSYYQPWLVIMSDGRPTDRYAEAARRSKGMAESGKLNVIAVGIGDDYDKDILEEFCNSEHPPRRLSEVKFKEFFKWLSASLGQQAKSMPGVDFEMADDDGWNIE